MMRIGILAVTLLLAIATKVETAFAQSAGLPISHSAISDAALAGSAGNIAINNSAGIGNAQANIAVISIGEGLASADISSRQQAAQDLPAAGGNKLAEIGSNAFRNATGIIAVNQSSCNGNTQANLVAIAFGKISEVSIDQLGRVSASQDMSANSTGGAEGSGKQKSAIADSAFIGARGIVQVNQLAGSGNSSANVFAFSVGVGTQ
jgi:hypothetical protein